MSKPILLFFIIAFIASCRQKPSGAPVIIPKKTDSLLFQPFVLDTNQSPLVLSKELQEITYRLDTMMERIGRSGDFNGTVLIAKRGKILLHQSYGWAIKDNLSMQPNSVFQLASVSKTITATAILLLYDKGFLDLDDPITKYLPQLGYLQNISIRQLLNHRSGLPNYLYFTEETYAERLEYDYMSNAELVQYMAECPPPIDYAPDQRFIYCNTNYALLASIIESISNKSFADFMQIYIFKPLGMKNSKVLTPYEFQGTKNQTLPYYINWRQVANNYQDGVFGDKGIYSTPYDLYLLNKALYSGLLSSKAIMQSQTNYVTEPHRLKQYGLGWRMHYLDDSTKVLYHNGWWHGYRAAFHKREQDSSCVIMLSNKLNRQLYQAVVDAMYILNNQMPASRKTDEDGNVGLDADSLDLNKKKDTKSEKLSKPDTLVKNTTTKEAL